ncbi:unnamed protein product [Prunus armeniaca]
MALNCTDILSSKTIGCGTRKGKLYYLDMAPDSEARKLFPSISTSLDISSFKYDICELAKSHCVPFLLSSNKSSIPFSLMHYDVWGPTKIATPRGARWFVTFTDDCTRLTWISLLKTEGEVSSKFQQFQQMVETQFQATMQVLRPNGGEILNQDLNKFLQSWHHTSTLMPTLLNKT